jgi:hypothetical protein
MESPGKHRDSSSAFGCGSNRWDDHGSANVWCDLTSRELRRLPRGARFPTGSRCGATPGRCGRNARRDVGRRLARGGGEHRQRRQPRDRPDHRVHRDGRQRDDPSHPSSRLVPGPGPAVAHVVPVARCQRPDRLPVVDYVHGCPVVRRQRQRARRDAVRRHGRLLFELVELRHGDQHQAVGDVPGDRAATDPGTWLPSQRPPCARRPVPRWLRCRRTRRPPAGQVPVRGDVQRKT